MTALATASAAAYVWAQHRPGHDDDAIVSSACRNRAIVRELVAKHGLTAEIEAAARIRALIIISTGMCHRGAA